MDRKGKLNKFANALIKQRLCQFVSERYSNSYCTPIFQFQPAVFAFHDNHGTRIVLSNNQRTAKRTDGKSSGTNGIVMSRDTMQVNHLYEVSCRKKE